MPTIADEIRVLSRITRRPSSTAELAARMSLAPQELDVVLTLLRDDGAIACTNGIWYRRPNKKEENNEHP